LLPSHNLPKESFRRFHLRLITQIFNIAGAIFDFLITEHSIFIEQVVYLRFQGSGQLIRSGIGNSLRSLELSNHSPNCFFEPLFCDHNVISVEDFEPLPDRQKYSIPEIG
jgi:hypothetical protein